MIVQGSPEWFAQRLGKATASKIADIMAKTKTGPSAMRINYAAQLIAERLTGVAGESFTNAAMQWGTDHEADACDAYAWETDAEIEECGFIDHPTVAMSGASPDRLVGSLGLLEVKCPETATHLETLDGASISSKYLYQMQWQLACTGRAWCDFASFDPRLPGPMRLHVTRVPRADALIAELESEVSVFLAEIDRKVARLNEKYGAGRAAEKSPSPA